MCVCEGNVCVSVVTVPVDWWTQEVKIPLMKSAIRDANQIHPDTVVVV